MRSPAVTSWHGTTGLGSCPDRRHRTGSTFDLSAIFDFQMKSKRQNHSAISDLSLGWSALENQTGKKILRMRPYGGCTGDPSEIRKPRPLLTKGGRRSLPPGQHLTAANAPAARRWSLSAGHHFSAPAHPSGRPQQQQAVFRASDYPAGAPCAPVSLRASQGPKGAGGAG